MKIKFPLDFTVAGLLVAGALIPSCKSDEKVCDTALQDSLQLREMRLREREMDLREREVAIMERERTLGITPGSPGSYSYRGDREASGAAGRADAGSRTGEAAMSARATGRNRLQGYGNDPRGAAYKKPVLAFPGQYPESSERVLTDKDMEHQTTWGKRIMLNEIYARHGYIFPDADLKRHFADESWYKGTEKNMAKLKLSALEKQNIAFIQAH